MNTYIHRYGTEAEYTVFERFPDGHERSMPHDQHDYLAWVTDGNTPIVEAAGRFLSVVDNEIVVDPDKGDILAAEAVAVAAEETRKAAKAQALIDNLPSWSQVDGAIDNISSLAEAKTFIRKLARITYWMAKGTKK